MEKKVYGVIGILSKMANWNADFSGYPKSTSNGEIYGSDKALKYPMKKMWDNSEKKVLYIKSMQLSEDKKGETIFIPKTLEERYQQLFPDSDLKKKDYKEVLTNLFRAVDVKNFGATFAVSGINVSITGAVQIGQGYNKYENSTAQEQNILSPFRNPKGSTENGEAKNSSIGTKIVSDEAHYFYPFVVNPLAYKEFVELGVTEGYTEEDYKNFKDAALTSATAFATNAKEGCENEFALFIETARDLYLPILDEYIKFTKCQSKNIISIECGDMINNLKNKILNIEIYYNSLTTEIKTDIEGVKYFDIITRKQVEE